METILSIAGKPGLYKLVSRGKMNLIVESLDETHRRQPAFFTDRVTNLGDIAMYTDADDVPLWKVLKSVGEQEQNKLVSFNYKKAEANNCANISPRCCHHSIKTACTTATSRNCCNGTTFL